MGGEGDSWAVQSLRKKAGWRLCLRTLESEKSCFLRAHSPRGPCVMVLRWVLARAVLRLAALVIHGRMGRAATSVQRPIIHTRPWKIFF